MSPLPEDAVEAALAALAAAPDAKAAENPLRQLREALVGADALRQATVRARAVEALEGAKVSAPARLVDAALVRQEPLPQPAGQGRPLTFDPPEPWPDPVDGSALLDELSATFRRFLALPPHAHVALAFWTLHAHALEAADASPILALLSPEKRCGKTTTMSLLKRLVPRPLPTSNVTPAALFRVIESTSPTLLIDEADTFLKAREELRGVLNAGHTRETAFVLRTVGDEYEPRSFSTWAAKALALIGRLPETLMDRSIVIPMRRRAPNESIERLRSTSRQALAELSRKATRWADDHFAELCAADPKIPEELSDRAADNWRPLLAIADAAGGEWPEAARRAALALSGESDLQDSVREQLLSDIRAAFREREEPVLFTEDLLSYLHELEERPWSEWQHGRAMSAVQLARQLKPFGVRPRSRRQGVAIAKGYALEDFAEAFTRYLPAEPSQPSQSNGDSALRDDESRHTSGFVTDHAEGANPSDVRIVTGVTDQYAGSDWGEV